MTDLHISVKAVVVHHDKLLLIQYRDTAAGETGFHYNVPGGRLLPNETLHQGVRRKALEEAGATVRVGPVLLVYEYVGANHRCCLGEKHSVSLLFRCSLDPNAASPGMNTCTRPDSIQTDVTWVHLGELETVIFWPNIGRTLLRHIREVESNFDLYVGDVM